VVVNKCTFIAGCIDGHGGAPEQYRWHCPMRHDHFFMVEQVKKHNLSKDYQVQIFA
jgi:hypothetical protein